MSVLGVLRPYVRYVAAYDVDFGAPGVHRGLPGTALTFVLPLDEPLCVGWAGSNPVSAWSNVSGLHTTAARIHHNGRQRGVQLGMTVAGARALLGVPASALRAEMLELGTVAAGLRHLPEQLAQAPWPRAAEVVQRALVMALASNGSPAPKAEVGRALAALARGVRVADAADEVGYSRRHLSDLVRAECGLTPKEYQRVARFEASHRLVGRLPLARVAAMCGYADQAHLTREWQSLAGCSPTAWIREEFPHVQDPSVTGSAGWGHESE